MPVHLESAYLHVRFSFDDAAVTALCYAALQTLLRTLACAGALPRTLDGRVEMDFRAEGTEVFASGIIGARLGSLGMAATSWARHFLVRVPGATGRRRRRMQQHPIDNMMQTTMENIRSMVDVNTVVGAPVTGTKGTTIIPISKVSFGFIAGRRRICGR